MFKVGDKVKCVEIRGYSGCMLRYGAIYTISETFDEGCFVTLKESALPQESRFRSSSFISEDAAEDTGGTKYDIQKPRTDLLPPDALLGAAEVFTFGATKYGERNWEKGIQNTRLIGSALRHLFSVMKGDLIDSESGLPHIDHALCCVLMLSDNFKNRKEMCNG